MLCRLRYVNHLSKSILGHTCIVIWPVNCGNATVQVLKYIGIISSVNSMSN
jgi:hypothetical protein